jgi:hypothetical protein
MSAKVGFGENVIYREVYSRVLWGGVRVTVFGASNDWNYSGTLDEMKARNPWVVSAVRQVIVDHDIKRALVPKPSFNASVVQTKDLNDEILLGFFRGANADGVLIDQSGYAYFLASVDCLTTVIYDSQNHRVLCMHCGLNALVDRDAIEGKPARKFPSVIDTGMGLMKDTPAASMCVFLVAGIKPKSFSHPTSPFVSGSDGNMLVNQHCERNTHLIDHLRRFERNYAHLGVGQIVFGEANGHIDLNALVCGQLSLHGVPNTHVESDGHDTATDKYHNGDFMFHSNRRDHNNKRNLVVVELL